MNENIYTITELTRLLKAYIEKAPAFNGVWVSGEISNVTYHSSGHIYLTLKDENAVLSSVFFKYANRNLTFRLEEGMSVFAQGNLTVFEKRGSYQFIISQLKLEGIGELQKQIEQLKKKLLEEGIFDPARKRPLPFLPKRIGIVTSPTGAAVRDIIKVAKRRYPDIEILIAPAKVQGADAGISIVNAIEELNRPEWNIDIIIAGRGGGSFEDLMAFNEEAVVRAFFNSRVPIISAVGHQVDHPLSDDSADVCAPTPSAAAEIAIPVKDELIDYLFNLRGRSYTALLSRIRELNFHVDGFTRQRVFRNPLEIVSNRNLLLDDTEKRLIFAMRDIINTGRNNVLVLPDLVRMMHNVIKDKTHGYLVAVNSLEKLSPLSVMKRGFAIAADSGRNIVRSIRDIERGEDINVFLSDGSLECTVNSKTGEQFHGKEKN
ncbi:MAG TPA: exodeoxyribonuclease VII large subunit [Spirochaetota bacterium]|nr:exodeoxyribonuclease VII large subunit [Spirochaetota bacterium]HPJ37481.1 exodeoxyribonuclease VII large subunit [Spirochaetota bacterium]HPQ51846.1 exodeoxyribonuclease VII large subunit [Spirochaetota bacterium]